MNGEEVARTEVFTYLGVSFDRSLGKFQTDITVNKTRTDLAAVRVMAAMCGSYPSLHKP